MRGELFEQQLGYSVGLLVEHPMRDTLEDLEAVLAADVAAIGVRPLLSRPVSPSLQVRTSDHSALLAPSAASDRVPHAVSLI